MVKAANTVRQHVLLIAAHFGKVRPFNEDIPFLEGGMGRVNLVQQKVWNQVLVVKTISPRGETVYWVGAAGAAADAGDGTDFHAVEQGFASVTPLQIDLTNHDEMARVRAWFAP